MKRLFLVISLIIIGLSAKAQDGEYHVRIHGQQNKGIIFEAPAASIDSMYINENGELRVRKINDSHSFSFAEIDSLTFPWIPTGTGDIVYITYNGTSVEIVNPYPSTQVIISVNEGTKVSVTSLSTANITYCLSGTANPGRFEIASNTTPTILLNGLNLTNPTGKAMDLTCDAGIILQLADGTTNSLSDGTTSDKKAALMCNSDLLVLGNGTINLTSYVKHPIKVKGICTINSGNFVITSDVEDVNGFSADSTLTINGGSFDITMTGVSANCIKADKELTINGGTFILNNSGNVSKGINCNSDITINDGNFTITASGGTVVTDYDPSYCTAIKCDANIIISGGTFNITLPTSNNGGKGISCDGDMIISGNNTINIETHGDGSTYTASSGTDTYSSSCLRADGNMEILSGNITLTSTGKAGKGIKVGSKNGNSYTGTYTQGNTDGTGPTLTITTSGAQIGSSGGWPPGPGGGSSSSRASAKAIKVGGIATIYGGTTTVHTSTSGAEGLESKTQINIEGGQHYFKCYDDCINSSGKIFFNGGVTVCFSNGNDAVDSNAGTAGAITIGNGVAFAYTTKGSPEEGFDCDNNNYIRITGTGIGISAGGSQGGGGWPGGGGSGGTITNPAQGYKFYTSSYTFQTGRYYTLSNANGTGGTNMVTFSFEANCSSTLALITATGMVSGQTYYVKYGTQAPTGATTDFHGLYLGGTSSASEQAFSFQAQ